MSDRPEATVRPVEESEATGRVAAIFADIKATKEIDFVPNFWRVLATNPDHLELIWTRLKAIMHPEADGRTGPARPADPRDHRAGRLGDQRLRLLRQLAHGGRPQARAGRRGAGEVMAVVGLFNSTNAIADGYQIEPDVFPPQD